MNKLIVTIGISGSGKTTWAETQTRNNPGTIVNVNRDDVRVSLYCDNDYSKYSEYKFSKESEQLVTKICEDRIKLALSQGKTVIVSDTNINPKVRDKFNQMAKYYDIEYQEKVFEVELEECIRRQYLRKQQIPTHVIVAQHNKMIEQGFYSTE